MTTKKENLIIFLVLLVLSVSTIYNAYMIPAGGELGYGASFMPKLIAFLLAFCSLCFLVKWLRAEKASKTDQNRDWIPMVRFAAALGLLILYVALLKKVGFIVMTIVYIFLQSLLMVPLKERNYLLSAIIAVISAVVIFFIFTKGLNLILPAGILSGIL